MAAKLYIFDLDGTIIDSKQDIRNAILKTVDHFTISPPSDEEVTKACIVGVTPFFKKLAKSEEQNKEYLSFFKEYFIKHLADATTIFDGILEVLEHLNKVHELVILTNKIELYAKKTIDNLNLNQYFSAVYCGDTFSESKPSPLPIYEILKVHPYKNEHTIIIGDSESDILSGQKAGIKTCLAKYGYGDTKELSTLGADYQIDFANQILDIKF